MVFSIDILIFMILVLVVTLLYCVGAIVRLHSEVQNLNRYIIEIYRGKK
jgi:hypothetical protein